MPKTKKVKPAAPAVPHAPPTVPVGQGDYLSARTLLAYNLKHPDRLIYKRVLEALGDPALVEKVAVAVTGLCDECYDAVMPCDCFDSNPPAGG